MSSSTDIERMVRDIAAGKTAKDVKPENSRRIIVRGGDGAARKVARDLSAMFTFAVRRGIVLSNPCENAAIRKTDNRRTRYLSIEEVRRLGAALETLQADGVNPKALDITRLWALTGCRRDEIAALKWSEVDFERGCLVLEDSKTGESVRPLATRRSGDAGCAAAVRSFAVCLPGDERRRAFPGNEEDLAEGHGPGEAAGCHAAHAAPHVGLGSGFDRRDTCDDRRHPRTQQCAVDCDLRSCAARSGEESRRPGRWPDRRGIGWKAGSKSRADETPRLTRSRTRRDRTAIRQAGKHLRFPCGPWCIAKALRWSNGRR